MLTSKSINKPKNDVLSYGAKYSYYLDHNSSFTLTNSSSIHGKCQFYCLFLSKYFPWPSPATVPASMRLDND